MLRNARHPCPVSYCTNARLRWMAVCPACYRRLPGDIIAAFREARTLRRADMKFKAGVKARDWLNAHPPAGMTGLVVSSAQDGAPP
jgi:hypothetical protein